MKHFIEGIAIFHETEGVWWKNPWRLLCRKGYKHVQVFVRHNTTVYDDVELWSVFNPGHGATVVYPMLVEDIREDVLNVEYEKAIYFRMPTEDKVILRGIGSCVGTVKMLLGVRWYSIWTPYQLYKKLLKQKYSKEV